MNNVVTTQYEKKKELSQETIVQEKVHIDSRVTFRRFLPV